MSVWGDDSEAICGDPTCYRGRIGGWNYQFKDGPCASKDCKWPPEVKARPHFTDTPSKPIVDAGKEALCQANRQRKQG